LMYSMLANSKHSLGRLAYYLRSAQLFFRQTFSPFTVTTPAESTKAVSAMAVRVADLGGLFSPLVRGGAMDEVQLRLTTIAAPAHLALPAWFALSWARLHRLNRYVRTHQVDTFHCSVGETSAIQV
jgi:diacylglycerol kinase (ATP)